MTRDEALKLLRGGLESIEEWNLRCLDGEETPSLSRANLRGTDLSCSWLEGVDLSYADLQGVILEEAALSGANLHRADLNSAILVGTDLTRADLRNAMLFNAVFIGCGMLDANFTDARWGWTTLANVDLENAQGLNSAVCEGPCSISVDTLTHSRGQIAESFLHGCGFQAWQILEARLHDPDLTREQIHDLQAQIFDARTNGPLFIGSVFISYSSDDVRFATKIYDLLKQEGATVYMDLHDMIAGDSQKQIDRAIRSHNTLLLVLSESSINSDWVEHELEMARRKEKSTRRAVLCPVALDKSWKSKRDDVRWEQVFKKHVLDFSRWKTRAFEPEFRKLVSGLKVNYGPTEA